MATLAEAGRRWVEDYASRSGQSLDAVLSGDVAKLTDSLLTLPKGLRTATVNWCVNHPSQGAAASDAGRETAGTRASRSGFSKTTPPAPPPAAGTDPSAC